jgi:predicted restriction endonuclease
VDWSNVTLNAMKQRTTFQYSARIRQVARQVYRQSDKPKKCLVCGYDKHYEVCHKVGIADFADDTSIAEINHLDNLVALCPNHHWELDHNHLTL